MKFIFLVALTIFVSSFAEARQEIDGCREKADAIERACGRSSNLSAKFLVTCNALKDEQLPPIDRAIDNAKSVCANVGRSTSQRAAKGAQANQAKDAEDVGTLLDQSRATMDSCAKRMKFLNGEVAKMQKVIDGEMKGASSASGNCKTVAEQNFNGLKEAVDERANETKAHEGSYRKGADATKNPAAGNNENAEKMKNDNASKQAGGAGGAGMPNLPSPPPQKKDDSAKKQAEALAKIKAEQKAKCISDRTNRDTKKRNCEIEFPTNSGVTVTGMAESQKQCKDKEDQNFQSLWATPCESL